MRLNRKMISIGGLLAILILSSGWLPHKFYVSLTELNYNAQSKRFEVSMRIFSDDLDQALLERSGIQTQLATELEHDRADSLMSAYILENFSIHVEDRMVALNYLGKEPESDAIWCYLESDPVSDPVSAPQVLSIRNELLTELFPDQVNIVQVYWEKWNKGLLLNRNQSSGNLTLGE